MAMPRSASPPVAQRRHDPPQRWYDLTCETLSPLHTSLGPEALLIPDEDCVVVDGQTLVLDREALIAEFQVRPPAPPLPQRETYRDVLKNPRHPLYDTVRREYELGKGLGFVTLDTPIDQDDVPAESAPAPAWETFATTRPRDLPPDEQRWRADTGRHLVRYVLDGTPDAPEGQGWVQAISRLPRTPDGAIVLPGSGLKGALRSLLAYAAAERHGAARLPEEGRNAKFAAQDMERQTLAPRAPSRGNAPNYDAGRLLIVRDAPLDPAVRARIAMFGLLSARSWRPFGTGTQTAATALETVPAGVTFRARLGLDLTLLHGWRERDGVEPFAPLRPVLPPDLGPLLAAGRALALAQLEADARLYTLANAARAAEFTAALTQRLATLPPNATLLRLGWGTGRMSKTPFAVLLHQAGNPRYAPQRSRRLTAERQGIAGLPFGWVVCTVRQSGSDGGRAVGQ